MGQRVKESPKSPGTVQNLPKLLGTSPPHFDLLWALSPGLGLLGKMANKV